MSRYNLDDLTYLMERLRDPEFGCPWDIKQSFATIVPHTLEEAYEVADAIEREDWPHLEDELGDLLFQVIFYTQLGKEDGLFDISSVIDRLCQKLVRRHPHVFPTGNLRDLPGSVVIDEDAVNAQWEAIKQEERNEKSRARVLDEVPVGLPALSRAVKLTKRAAKVGFDWDSPDGVFAKLDEELAELKDAIKQEDPIEIEAELGDLLFVMANLARKLGVDPERAVRGTNLKFERRFNYVEDQVDGSEKSWGDHDLQQLDFWWDEAKKQGL